MKVHLVSIFIFLCLSVGWKAFMQTVQAKRDFRWPGKNYPTSSLALLPTLYLCLLDIRTLYLSRVDKHLRLCWYSKVLPLAHENASFCRGIRNEYVSRSLGFVGKRRTLRPVSRP